MLSLNEISNVTLSIDTSDNETAAWSSAIFLGDESEIKLLIGIDLKCLDIKIAEDARDLEWCILKMVEIFHHVIVKDEVRVVAYTIWVFYSQIDHYAVTAWLSRGLQCLLDVFLYALAQVYLIREVE